MGRLEFTPGSELTMRSADLKDAFCHLAFPEALRPLFTLPAVDGRHLKGLQVCGARAVPGQKYYPRLSVVPMGWS